MKVYIIWDTKENVQWTNKGKAFWLKKGFAKTAFFTQNIERVYKNDDWWTRNHRPYFLLTYGEKLEYLTEDWKNRFDKLSSEDKYAKLSIKFEDQTRFKCLEFDLDVTQGKEV